MQEKEFERQNVFKKGAENTAYAQFFIGTSYLNPLTSPQNKPFWTDPPLRGGGRLVPGLR